MKKIVLTIILLLGIILPVKAANYEFRELIPAGITTTIRGDTFLYKNFVYQAGVIKIETVKNNSKDTHNLSISIGLFDKNNKNIGTINYCDTTKPLGTKTEEKDLLLDVNSSYLEKGKSYKDIKYVSVLSENTNCRTEGATDYVGQTVEQIGQAKNNTLNADQVRLINILTVIGVVLFALFVYKFLFTNAYRNMDGEDVRQEYSYINKQLRREREREARIHPPEPKVVKTNKTDEILKQEEEQNTKSSKANSALHNLYK